MGGPPIKVAAGQTLGDSAAPNRQSHLLVGIAQGLEQAPDPIGTRARNSNNPQRRRGSEPSGGDAFEQSTFKLPAVVRPVRVQPTVAACQAGAGLGEFGPAR